MRKCGCLGSSRKASTEVIDQEDNLTLIRKGSWYCIKEEVPAYNREPGRRSSISCSRTKKEAFDRWNSLVFNIRESKKYSRTTY
jgi:hypothetical protein